MTAPEQPTDRAAPPTAGAGALDSLEEHLLGERPTLTQAEVADQAGISLDAARELWHLLGFAHAEPEERAFTQGDVRALKLTQDLTDLGLLTEDRQDGMVRTLGRSFARLAEWQVGLLAETALDTGIDPTDGILELADEVTPRVEELQTFVWRRHVLNAASRMLAVADAGDRTSDRAVCFVDIVGYTSRSRTLTDRELVTWLEAFETAALDTVIEHNGRIIKNIGDELLIVADTAEDAAAIAMELTRRGSDEDDDFPDVRAGVAYGEVVTRLGDVFGPVVNIAARLTSVARPGTVLIDKGMYAALTGAAGDDADTSDTEGPERDESPYRFRRVRRVSVKGYSRLHPWALQPRD
ncbi:adenylate/guanylate cyclase domain-containing protein [Nocardioides bizhenqiangii]|uniref:Adenylate/guanylate cyclase domain-containing protein n=1 Tax=Nocardioides bizhenqiangii TaxID=3095076 RepID=A0ABZ0ZSD8_9ACTN|nr:MULTISPECIES: adenylate/guanylate cyclase domain-containing protein [unclassified Nocardioides]MDZ5619577.1 adenylate/guanylate cyclase domain-containing protein [Nocardioides sp. HM23]WQQ26408.1 adenylate/guanylate cyclase domain-containing protein [Nocardioides sp. HM61]